MKDLTAVYYTANKISEKFAKNAQAQLLMALGDLPLITVSHEPMMLGKNIVVELEPSHFNIYRQALIGAEEAKTKYIALCEDDVLYSPAHFEYRPNPGKFAYNLGAWSIFTWQDPPMFTHKGVVRKNLNSLICERDLFVEAMRERFDKYPNDEVSKDVWGEPGRYEHLLGVTVRETEEFYTNPPNIIFSHPNELSYEGLGKRKRHGEYRATVIPYWHSASEVMRLYNG